MKNSTLAALLLIVMFLGLALTIVMFGIIPTFGNLTGGPETQPITGVTLLTSTEIARTPQPAPTSYLSPSGTAMPTPEASPSAAPTPDPTTAATADSLLAASLQKDAAGARYRYTTWGTYSMQTASSSVKMISLRIDGEVDHDNSRQIMTTTEQTADDQYSQLETRVVDGVPYSCANQQWQKGTTSQVSMQQQFFQDPVDFLNSSVHLIFVGTEKLPDVPVLTYKYRFEIPSSQSPFAIRPPDTSADAIPTLETQQEGYLWIGTDGRRYQVEYRMRLYIPQSNMVLGWDLTTHYFDQDDPTIHIEAPEGAVPLEQ